jgi:hypothetical protein
VNRKSVHGERERERIAIVALERNEFIGKIYENETRKCFFLAHTLCNCIKAIKKSRAMCIKVQSFKVKKKMETRCSL